MARSINLAAVDGKQATFCSDCRLFYLERLTQQGHDHE
jgi:predicted Zn-dependent protease